jgi:hypothetical protein
MEKRKIKYIAISIVCILVFSSIPGFAYSINMEQTAEQNNSKENFDVPLDSDWYYKPESYDQLVGWYQDLESNFSNFIEVFKANEMYGTGQATGGYDLYYVRITNESTGFHKPEVLFLGGPHGDETVGTIGMYWFLDWFTRKAFTDEPCEEYSKEWLNWLVDNREIYFEVSHNPYGFDHGPQRYDGNGWDLNREADYDGPGDNTGGIWASENGQTLYRFINNHTIRTGCDIHGGTRMLLYPWASTYHDVVGTSPISGESYDGAPPDFYFYDAAGLRVGSYIGDGGGDGMLDESNVGTIDELIWYAVYGGIAPWAYAADVEANPQEDEYVEDETFGNYPGAGIMWYSPEMSYTKNPSESTFGNDTTDGWGWEMRRFILHQTDIAQPYVRWIGDTVDNHVTVEAGEPIPLRWQVNGSMVVDHTSVQYGSDPDPVNNYDFMTGDYDEYAGDYVGGTGWENAMDGSTDGVVYMENISISEPGEYYFVAKAQVDQVYGDVLEPGEYGDDPYLRLIKERTNDSYYESLVGTDGLEEIVGQTWWHSPVIHVTVGNMQPTAQYTWSDADGASPGTTIDFDASASTAENITLYEWDWTNDGIYEYSSDQPMASFDYGDANSYQCTLRITDNLSQTDTTTKTVQANVVADVEQTVFDRGFPIRHAVDGDWAGAQNFTPTMNMITKVELYLRSFGTPEFDLTVELRENDPEGTLIDTQTYSPSEVSSSWSWFTVDFTDTSVDSGTDYFIVCPPAPSGVTSSFGYEWGYAFNNQYDDGSFWFTRDGGNLWRDLPTMYEFTFKTYGIN